MREYYLQKAERELPNLIRDDITLDVGAKIMSGRDCLVIDLGNHYVGYFSFTMGYVDLYIDAPVKLSVKFCETARELDDDFSAYKGRLCASWLQEEIVHIDFPGVYQMPRRYAARFIMITVLHTPKRLVLSDFVFTSVSSADRSALREANIADEELRSIDQVAVNTLKNCMHRVFEDGPKRDRRLWTGDLRLEALTNYCTFDNLRLVRRCLYLFAAAEPNARGFIPGFLYEDPVFVSGSWFLEDYALLFVISLCDYYQHTGDFDTFWDLYPAARAQMEAAALAVDEDGLITVADGCDAFIDWCPGLRKLTALHGVYLYALSSLSRTLARLGHADGAVYARRLEEARLAARAHLYDPKKAAFVNGRDGEQYSVHSTVWMILGEVITGDEAVKALSLALNSAESLKPCTPYMHHYVVEAMMKLRLTDEALSYIKRYWGGMVKEGADTFFEAFVPGEPEFSPYGDRMINSMCHAWSCTPAYFIRTLCQDQSM